MNEIKVMFYNSNNDQLCPSFPIQKLLNGKNREFNIWDEDLIASVILFGTDIVFGSSKDLHIFCIYYPKIIKKEIIQKYLYCHFWDHLWGNLECSFRYKDYIVDLVCDSIHHLDFIKEQLTACQQVYTEFYEDIPKLTKAGRKFIAGIHEQYCSITICNCPDDLKKTNTYQMISKQ